MDRIVKANVEEFFPIILNLLYSEKKVQLTVTGNSMFPFLRHGKDVVELETTAIESIKTGDIVLIQRKDKTFVLHRVVKKKPNCFYIAGDAEMSMEGPIYSDQLKAIVTRVLRNGESISLSVKNKWKIYIILFKKNALIKKILVKLFSLLRKA